MGNRKERQPLRLLWVFVFGFLFSLAVVAGFFLLFAAQAAGRWDYWAVEPRLDQDHLFGVARNAVTLAAALGVGITLFFSYRKQQTSEKSQILAIQAQETANKAQELATRTLRLSLDKHDLEQTSELRNRYARSAEQLGSDKTAVQLAGIHSLASLADDWAAIGNVEEQQVCISLLCSFMNESKRQERAASEAMHLTAAEVVQSRLSFDPDRPFKSWGSSTISLSGATFSREIRNARIVGGTFHFTGCSWRGWHAFEEFTIEGGSSVSFLQGANDTRSGISFSQGFFKGGSVFIHLPEQVTARSITFMDCIFSGSEVTITSANRGTTDIRFVQCTFASGNVKVSTASGSASFAKCKFEPGGTVKVYRLEPVHVAFKDCQYGEGMADMRADPVGAVMA